MSALRRFSRLAPPDRRLVVQACGWLVVFRIALWVLPWRRVIALVGASPTAASSRSSVDRLEWAVRVTSRCVPRATCLTQSLALARLLARNGYTGRVQIGVRHGTRFDAHAWVEHEGTTLLTSTGSAAQYSRLISWDVAPPVRSR